MIHSLTVQNFKSIKNQTTLNFTVGDKAPSTNKYAHSHVGKRRVSKVSTIIGPNASGKTTILESLIFLEWVIVRSSRDQRNNLSDVYSPFATETYKKKPTKVAAVFELNNKIYEYKIECRKDQILSEYLSVTNKANVRLSSKTLVDRSWDSTGKKYISQAGDGMLFDLFQRMNPADQEGTSLLSFARRFGDKTAIEIVKYWIKMESNIDLPSERFYSYDMETRYILHTSAHDKKAFGDFLDELRKYDSGVEDYDSESNYWTHRTSSGEMLKLETEYQSSGTKQLIVVLSKLTDVLKNGGVAVIDEFDAFLHPAWLNLLVSRFFDPVKNPKNAQLIMSTHSMQILNLLDKYQVFISEKLDDTTDVYRVDEVEGIRADDNYYAKYMAGNLGGLPNLE